MKITDFRTGNFYTDGSNILIVRLIDNYPSSGDKINNTPLLEEYIKPIPLTDEWMFKFGFKKHKSGIGGADMWQGMNGWSLGDSGWLFRGNSKSGLKLVGYFNTTINYVHQLQNLYYALTGEELQYTQAGGV